MAQNNPFIKRTIGLAGTITGGLLISLPTLPFAASAVSYPLNPCPGIYYEEPFNSTRVVPQGCPPNAATQSLTEQEQTLYPPRNMPASSSGTRAQPPLPESLEAPIATINSMDETVDVELQNNTNARIAYQAIGYTEQRTISGGETVVLQDLPTPVTITMFREDSGLLQIMPMSSAEPGSLSISLGESTDIDSNQGALRIQSDGQVFLN